LLDLVNDKLKVPGIEKTNVLKEKYEELISQLDTQLKPVLREKDFREFNLDQAIELVQKIYHEIVNY